jgi:exopolysaccharide production protein ExoZ
MIWSLQVLRFVAAIMVVYVHAAQIAFAATGSSGTIPRSLAIVGQSGVDIFFVLSGAIITTTAPGLKPLEFAWRRFRRVVPLYFLLSIPAMLIAAKTEFGWRESVATLLLWPATDVMTPPALPVAWTLCFEMLFYASGTLVLVDSKWTFALAGVFGASFLLREKGPVFQFLGNPIMIEFLFGVGIAYLSRWQRARSRDFGRRSALWLIPLGSASLLAAGLAGFAPDGGSLESLVGDQASYRVAVYGIPAAFIVFGTMQMEARKSLWTYLGDGSYTLYLSHTFVVSPLLNLWAAVPIPSDLIILITIGACLIFSWRLYERVERPLLAFLRKKYEPNCSAEQAREIPRTQ